MNMQSKKVTNVNKEQDFIVNKNVEVFHKLIMENKENSFELPEKFDDNPKNLYYYINVKDAAKQVFKALDKLCYLYNKDYKSRGFIRFIIKQFAYQTENSIDNMFGGPLLNADKITCCLTNQKLHSGLFYYYLVKQKLDSNKDTSVEVTTKEIYDALSENDKLIPKTIVGIDKSCDKFISQYGLMAVKLFVNTLKQYNDFEIIKILESKPRKTNNFKNKSYVKRQDRKKIEEPKTNGFNMSSVLSEDDMNKLKNLRK